MKIPFMPKPKLTPQQQIAANVAEFGLSETVKGYTFARDYKGNDWLGEILRPIGIQGLKTLQSYAPSPSIAPAIGAAKQSERERLKRMRGRGHTRLTSPGFLMLARTRSRGLKSTLG